MKHLRHVQFAVAVVPFLILSGCGGTPSIPTFDQGGEMPEICALQDGLSVEALTIIPEEQIDLTSRRGVSVRARLNQQAAPSGQAVCFVVRDDQFPVNPPLTIGLVIIQAGQTSATTPNAFYLDCDVNRHVIAQPVSFLAGEDALAESSNERSTKIFVQHVADGNSFNTLRIWNPITREFQEALTGIDGVKSNRPRVSCPR